MRGAVALAAIFVAGGLATAASAQPAALPNLNGNWTLDNERSSIWTVKQVGDTVTASRRGAPGRPNLVSSYKGFLYDFGPYVIVQGVLTNTGEGAPVTSNMCWTIRPLARPTEFQWGDCTTQLGKFRRVVGSIAASAPTARPKKSAPARRPNASPNFTSFGPVFRG